MQDAAVKLGSWQMVLWQPRWVHAEMDALCYQKITADERPIGKQKRIEFRCARRARLALWRTAAPSEPKGIQKLRMIHNHPWGVGQFAAPWLRSLRGGALVVRWSYSKGRPRN